MPRATARVCVAGVSSHVVLLPCPVRFPCPHRDRGQHMPRNECPRRGHLLLSLPFVRVGLFSDASPVPWARVVSSLPPSRCVRTLAAWHLMATLSFRSGRFVEGHFILTLPSLVHEWIMTPCHSILKVDKMLDEDLLVGPGRQARDSLRPLAYSTLADLVHHVKDRINLNQVSRVIQVRSSLSYDFLPCNVLLQRAACRLSFVDWWAYPCLISVGRQSTARW